MIFKKASLILTAITLLSLNFPVSSSAAPIVIPTPVSLDVTTVRGTILGPDNKPLILADITVTCDGLTKHTITGATGKFIVVFVDKIHCQDGDSVHVTASKGDVNGSSDGIVQLKKDGKVVDINVVLLNFSTTSVPEYNSIILVLAIVGSLGLYSILRRSHTLKV